MTNVARSVVRAAFPLLTLAVLAACGGGRGSSVTPPPQNSAPAAKAHGTLELTIRIPHLTASSTARHSTYVSASTQSIAITISQGATTVVHEAVGLTTTSNPNCSISGNTTTCTIALGLAAGSYTGTFATYDGPVVSNAATGNVLSQGQSVPLTVTASQTNMLAVVLDGVPASITITPASGSTITGTQSGGFTVPYTAQSMTVDALDADGNVILGSGAPTFTVSAPAVQFSVTQPTQGSPNTITVAATGGGSGTLSITAAAPDGGFSCSTSGVVCTASATIATPPHTMYVATFDDAEVYQSMDNVTWNQTATLGFAPGYVWMNGVPTTIAADANGDVAVTSSSASGLDVFVPPYSNGATSVDFSGDLGVAFTSTGTLLETGSTNLNVYAPPYTNGVAESATIPSADGNTKTVLNVVTDSANDAIVAVNGGGGAYLLASPYTTVTKTINSSGDSGALAIGSDGTVFVGTTDSRVLVYAPPYTSVTASLTLPNEGGAETAMALAVTPAGNLWALCYNPGNTANYIFGFTKPFSGSSTPSLAQSFSGGNTNEIASDSYGDLLIPTGTGLNIINSSGANIGTVGTGGGAEVFYVR
jgi:hypothetical protein